MGPASKGAQLRGVHLRLPGYGDEGPTLEIFSYSQMKEKGKPSANRKGLAHLAFSVEDVHQTIQKVIVEGEKWWGWL